MVLLQRNYTFPRIQRGSDISQGGGGSNFFRGGGGGGGGVLIMIFKETHITCDFLGGPDPKSPLWIRTCKIAIKVCFEPCHTRAAPIPCKS